MSDTWQTGNGSTWIDRLDGRRSSSIDPQHFGIRGADDLVELFSQYLT